MFELYESSGVNVVSLNGTHKEMGIQYGRALKSQLEGALKTLLDFYIIQHQVPYSKVAAQAEIFQQRYSYAYQFFLEGIAEGSGLHIIDCIILNAMETLGSLIRDDALSGCAFLSLPPSRTTTGNTMLGRNYDFSSPFKEIAKNLTVTILHEPDKEPSAIIAMPGQIYCPSCVNVQGLFMELNNGEPSGGFGHNQGRESLLIRLLEIVRNSGNSDQMMRQLDAAESDYSLIINTANRTLTRSYEFSSNPSLGTMKPFFPPHDEVFVSTNFYLNKTWKGIPKPTDNTTWHGVTRRDNLLKLASKQKKHSINDLKDIMNITLEDGGALWHLTIYQIIFDSSSLKLYIRPTANYQNQWVEVPLKDYFDHSSSYPVDTQDTEEGYQQFFSEKSSRRHLLQTPHLNKDEISSTDDVLVTSGASRAMPWYTPQTMITILSSPMLVIYRHLSLPSNDIQQQTLSFKATASNFAVVPYIPQQLFDHWSWDNTTQLHPRTGRSLFILRAFKQDTEVGYAVFYEHPLLCRSLDGTRHNVIESTGVFQQFVAQIQPDQLQDTCALLPLTTIEQCLISAKSAASHGTLRGTCHVIDYALQHNGQTSTRARIISELCYYGVLFNWLFQQRYQETDNIDESTHMTKAAYYAAVDTGSIAITRWALEGINGILQELSEYTQKKGWTTTSGILGWLGNCLPAVVYIHQASQLGVPETITSVTVGTVTESMVETVGKNTVDFFMANRQRTLMRACIDSDARASLSKHQDHIELSPVREFSPNPNIS